MKSAGIWLSAVSALALTACGQARKVAPHASAKVAAVAPPTAAPAPLTGSSAEQLAARAPGEPEGARAPATGHAAGRAFAAHAAVEARHTRPAAGRDQSVEDDDDAEALAADMHWSASDAREHRYSAAYRACMGSAHGFTATIADCYNAELVRQSDRLNRAFESAVAARSGERKRRLVLAQREWLHLRDSTCQDDDGPDLLHEGSCRLDLTIKRADALQNRAG
jgi:uncharacterized protein YecT (DUF1311 family)